MTPLCRTEIEQIMPLFKRCEFKKGKVGSSWREAIAVPSINMHRATQKNHSAGHNINQWYQAERHIK